MGTRSKDGEAGTDPAGGPSLCPSGAAGGVDGKAYSSLALLPRKSTCTCYRRYSINSGWIVEKLESESLFLI